MKNVTCRVLLIENSKDARDAFKRFFKKGKTFFDYTVTKSLTEARKIISSEKFDVFICEHMLDDGTAADILDLGLGIPLIVLAERGSVKAAVNIMKKGAADFLVKGKGSAYLKELSGVIEGITGNKKEKKGPLYNEIIDTAHILIWRTDAEGRFTFINPAWEQYYNYQAEEMIGKLFSDFQMPEAAEYYINAFRNCIIGEPVIGHETTFFLKTGNDVHLVINMIPFYDENGTIIGTQGIAYDITERRHADELLQYISAKDELTGLYNLHTFMNMTEQQIKTAIRENKEILIIYAGIDSMRSINDEYGYYTGDQALIDASNILRRTFREADVLSRAGGDEFIISTIVSSKDAGEMIMTRMKENLDMYNAGNTGSFKLSLSFGTSFYDPEQPVSIEKLLSHADEIMHEQKKRKAGR